MLKCITFHLTIEQNKLFSKLSIFQIVIDILQIRIDTEFILSFQSKWNRITRCQSKTKLTNCHHNIIVLSKYAAQATIQWLQRYNINSFEHIAFEIIIYWWFTPLSQMDGVSRGTLSHYCMSSSSSLLLIRWRHILRIVLIWSSAKFNKT